MERAEKGQINCAQARGSLSLIEAPRCSRKKNNNIWAGMRSLVRFFEKATRTTTANSWGFCIIPFIRWARLAEWDWELDAWILWRIMTLFLNECRGEFFGLDALELNNMPRIMQLFFGGYNVQFSKLYWCCWIAAFYDYVRALSHFHASNTINRTDIIWQITRMHNNGLYIRSNSEYFWLFSKWTNTPDVYCK